MNIRLNGTLCLLLAAILLSPSVASASDADQSALALKHYRCDALVQLNKMTDADQLVCDKLKSGGFDLASWEAGNRDQSIKLHEEVFAEFF